MKVSECMTIPAFLRYTMLYYRKQIKVSRMTKYVINFDQIQHYLIPLSFHDCIFYSKTEKQRDETYPCSNTICIT